MAAADNTITSGPFAGLTSDQLRAYFNTLPGPSAASVQASQQAHDAAQLAGARGDVTNMPARAAGANVDPTTGQVNVLNYSPQQQAFLKQIQTSNWTQPNGFDSFMSKALPVVTAAGLGAAFGPVAAQAIGAGAGTVGAGATTGAISGASQAALTGQNVGKGALIGGALGGIGQGVANTGVGKAATGALGNIGVPAPLATGIVKGAVGAGLGAATGAATGSGAAKGALTGGASGFTSGVIGNVTNSPVLGQVSGTIAGNLANKYLAPTTPPKASPPPSSVVAPPASAGTAQLPSLPTAPATNIGSYSGYGYQPRTQANPNINYATYGQGPEAQFFQNVGSPVQGALASVPVSNSPPRTATVTQGLPSTPQQRI